ncbi:hypothetical protein GCM10025880_56000 [Methylorubrum aminovorans]|nr:hypothetical protein [Methylorubrum aminovorans]GMA79183.1 hypothetical protein GCM10025880_56000 [Methylorubrum aminovorans]
MDVLQQMLQTGAEVQEQNVKAMKEAFDAFWSQSKPEPEPTGPRAAPSSPPASPSRAGEGSPPRRKPVAKS